MYRINALWELVRKVYGRREEVETQEVWRIYDDYNAKLLIEIG